jgi:hypothetical protein
MVKDTSFHYYFKNYLRLLEDFEKLRKEEFYMGKYCERHKMNNVSLIKLENEIKNVKTIINTYEQFRKNN